MLIPAVILGIVIGIKAISVAPPMFEASRTILEVYSTIPTPTPTPSKTEVIEYIAKTFEPEGTSVVVRAINCFYSESGLRWDAINSKNTNGTIDGGVAQINDVHKLTLDQRLDYKVNIDKAYQIYKGRGNFSAWYAPNCR